MNKIGKGLDRSHKQVKQKNDYISVGGGVGLGGDAAVGDETSNGQGVERLG